MRQPAWLWVLVVLAAACSPDAEPAGSSTTIAAPAGSLAGLAFEVHQEPG